MAEPNVLVPTSSVNGTVTTCGIDTQQISQSTQSAWSFRQTYTMRSYNKCTGQEISTYTVPAFTGLGLGTMVVGFVLVFCLAIKVMLDGGDSWY